MDRERRIQLLNRAVADELAAVHQHMYFHFHLDDQGFGPLAGLFKPIASQEMGHVEALAERVLFLKGDGNMVSGTTVERSGDAADMLAKAAQMEEASARDYNEAALKCGANADSASKQLFERLVREEEAHFDESDRQRENIKRFGPSYLALQSLGKTPGQASGSAE